MEKVFTTRITEMLGIDHPILCGGMQWVSRPEFVSHVCNAGALGFITAETFPTPEDLRQEIHKMRDLTDKPFGVNISMVPELGMPERTIKFCEVVCEEGIPVVETAGRSPEPLMPIFKQGGVKVIHKLTSIRHALAAERQGVDAVTILGYGSGGHVGMDNVASFILLPLAVQSLKIPVVAGGAVADGKGLLGALAMGAEAVLAGTVFFASKESPVHPVVKEKIVQTKETETTLVMRSIKNPMRVAINRLAEECLAIEEKGATLEEIIGLLAGGKGKLAYDQGDPDISPLACGQVAGLLNEIKSVQQIVDDMVSEASQLLDRLNRMKTV